MAYDFIDQNIVSTCLIQAHTDDSFYNPVPNQHTGYAFDGSFYSMGVIQPTHPKASWFTEFGTNSFRGSTAAFPNFGVCLLSPVSLVILDQSKAVQQASSLPLWMQFLLADNNAMANNFNNSVQGFLPATVIYADGIVSITYTPDSGNQANYNFPAWSPSTVYSDGNLVSFQSSRWKAVGSPTVGIDPPHNQAQWTAEILQPFPSPYPNVGVGSRMVVSIDFAQDSVYLDVAV